jgi:phage anti-repressor protein
MAHFTEVSLQGKTWIDARCFDAHTIDFNYEGFIRAIIKRYGFYKGIDYVKVDWGDKGVYETYSNEATEYLFSVNAAYLLIADASLDEVRRAFYLPAPFYCFHS